MAQISRSVILQLILFISVSYVQGQTARSLKQCWQQGASSRWCVPADGSTLTANANQPYTGYCCTDASTAAECTHGTDYVCTLNNKGGMELPLWSTYWPGVTDEICGGAKALTATDTLQTLEATPVITSRQMDQTYTEACFWQISTKYNQFYDSAEIWIYMDSSTTANIYVYQGSERRNATMVVAGNAALAVGAPIRVPVTEQAILVMQSTGAQARTGTAKFSYKVVGTYYSWYERPFIGIHVAWYYITIVIIFLVGLVVIPPIVLVLLSIALPCIPLGVILVCCGCCGGGYYLNSKNKGGKAGRLRRGRTRNSRFGRNSSPRSGVQSFSPPGGKGSGPPKKLGDSVRRQNTSGANESARRLQNQKQKIDEEWSGLPSPSRNDQSFRSQKSQSFKGKQSVADEWGDTGNNRSGASPARRQSTRGTAANNSRRR